MPNFHRLSRETLFEAQTDALERFARWLNLSMPRNTTSARQYRAELITRIQRAEKLIAMAPRSNRSDG